MARIIPPADGKSADIIHVPVVNENDDIGVTLADALRVEARAYHAAIHLHHVAPGVAAFDGRTWRLSTVYLCKIERAGRTRVMYLQGFDGGVRRVTVATKNTPSRCD